MNTILFKASGRSSSRPIVVLSHMSLATTQTTPASAALSRALSKAWDWVRCNCTPRRLVVMTAAAAGATAFFASIVGDALTLIPAAAIGAVAVFTAPMMKGGEA